MTSPSILRLLLFAAVVVLADASVAKAQAAVGSQLWLQGVAIVELSENWRLHLEEQPRFDDDVRHVYQVLTRTAIGRRAGSRFSVWAGHNWIVKPDSTHVAHEHRAWEQLSITIPEFGSWAPSIRLRTEQRWQGEWADWSHRIRIMGRGVRPLAQDHPWSVVLWGESFFNWDDTSSGPPRGMDQHRLFGGAARRVSKAATVEAGYLHVLARRRGAPTKSTPGAMVTLNVTL